MFAAKAVYCQDSAYDPMIDDGAFQVRLVSFREGLANHSIDNQGVAQDLQSKFLAYRCRHILVVRDAQIDLTKFPPGTRILARVLGSPIVGAPALEIGLARLLEHYKETNQISKWTDLRCVVAEALLHHVHKESGARVHVGEITETAMGILRGRGDSTQHEPREIGTVLRNFGLIAKRDGKGYAISLDSDAMHQLAHGLGLLAERKGATQCTKCMELLNSAGFKPALPSGKRKSHNWRQES